MTMRRQALRSRAPLATSLFLSLILVLLFTLPGILAKAEPAQPAPQGASAAATQANVVNTGDMNTGALLLQSEDGYGAAKDAGQKASLVEQERPNIFTNSVANIGPHESIVIRIEYQETVKQDGGVYSLRFPLVLAPRYNPEASNVNVVDFGGKPGLVDPVPDRDRISPPVLDPEKAGKINPVSIQVKLNAGFILGDIKSSQIAILALVLAFLSTLTFVLWLYHRRDYASPRRIGRRI